MLLMKIEDTHASYILTTVRGLLQSACSEPNAANTFFHTAMQIVDGIEFSCILEERQLEMLMRSFNNILMVNPD